MSITQNAWTTDTVNGFLVLTCTFSCDTTLYDTYTLKTPANTVDGTKPFSIFVMAAGTLDAQAVPFNLWVGYKDNFALSGDTPTLAQNGGYYVQLSDDIVLAVDTTAPIGVQHIFHIHPDLGVANVVTIAAIASGYKVNVPPSPYYSFAVDGGSAVSADLITINLVQRG